MCARYVAALAYSTSSSPQHNHRPLLVFHFRTTMAPKAVTKTATKKKGTKRVIKGTKGVIKKPAMTASNLKKLNGNQPDEMTLEALW